MLFLREFNSNLDTLTSLIVSGAFNSIFNMITILAMKDANRFGLNADFTFLKDALLALELNEGNTIEKTHFWRFFNRFESGYFFQLLLNFCCFLSDFLHR